MSARYFEKTVEVLDEATAEPVITAIAKAISKTFGLEVLARKADCSELFEPKLTGSVVRTSRARKRKRITIVLTKRELFQKASRNKNQWILGQTWSPTWHHFVETAREKDAA